jgi:hypothetical protein
MADMKDILVPVSPGELLDKITILRIKIARIVDAGKVANVRLELDLLEKTWADSGCAAFDVARDERALQEVNERLWDVEDLIREKEAKQTFDREFIELARAVYVSNDERAAIKKRINLQLGSRLVEEKSYKPYRDRPERSVPDKSLRLSRFAPAATKQHLSFCRISLADQ